MNREDIIDGTVTLTLDNDEELECEVVSIFEAGDREYISLLPLGGRRRRKRRSIYLPFQALRGRRT